MTSGQVACFPSNEATQVSKKVGQRTQKQDGTQQTFSFYINLAHFLHKLRCGVLIFCWQSASSSSSSSSSIILPHITVISINFSLSHLSRSSLNTPLYQLVSIHLVTLCRLSGRWDAAAALGAALRRKRRSRSV